MGKRAGMAMETRLRRGHAATAAAAVTAVVSVSVGLTWCLRGRRSISEDDRPTAATTRTDKALTPGTAPTVEICATASRSSFDSGQLLGALCVGGDGAVNALGGALEGVVAAVEAQPVTSSRAARRESRQLLDRLEGFSECLDADQCDRIARVGREQLRALCNHFSAVLHAVASDANSTGSLSLAVSELLACLERCDSTSHQAVSLLTLDGSLEGSADALELMCSLCCDPLEQPCLDECNIVNAVIRLTTSSRRIIRTSAWTALFVLAVRNGTTVAASSELCECVHQHWITLLQEVGNCGDAGEMREAMNVVAAHRSTQLATCLGMIVAPADIRAPLEAALGRILKSVVAELVCCSNATVRKQVQICAAMLDDETVDTALEIGTATVCQELIVFRSPVAAEAALALDIFPTGLRMLQRECIAALEPGWWVDKVQTVDFRCIQLWGLWTLLGATHVLETSVPASVWIDSDWLQSVLGLAVQMVRLNELADELLDAQMGVRRKDLDEQHHDEAPQRRPRCVNFGTICYAIRTIEAAARISEQQRFALLSQELHSALLYSFNHDLSFLGLSLRSSATSALVSLMGTHDEEDDFAVLDTYITSHVVQTFCNFFNEQQPQRMMTVASILPHARDLETCLISDVNKLVVLKHEGILDALVRGLLLNSRDPRVSQTGANTLREICLGALLQLSMVTQGADLLCVHDRAVQALASLCCCDVARLRVCAEHALHRIDACNDATTSFLGDMEMDTVVPRAGTETRQVVMLSYNRTNQADQAAVARIADSLRSRGYSVSMSNDVACSTVTTMCSAVHKAAAVLVCVSQSYIECPLCRAETMHIQQSDVPLVPLLLQHQGDGKCNVRKYQRHKFKLSSWARKMIGHKIQYSFHDEITDLPSAFESRIDELVQALGQLGKTSDPGTATIDEISAIKESEEAEEKSPAALACRLVKNPEERRLVLTQVLEHVILLLARSSRESMPALDRRTKAQLRARSSALLNDVTGVDASIGSSSAHALCAHRWSQYVGESTGAVLSDVFRIGELRSGDDVSRVKFFLEFVEKLSSIMQGRLAVLTDHVATGGQNCARVLLAAIDHGMQILDSLGTSTAHGSAHRSSLLSLSTEIGFSANVLNKFDAGFCDTLATACSTGRADARSIAQLILNVEQLTADADPFQSERQISALVAGMEKPVAATLAEQTDHVRARETVAAEQQLEQDHAQSEAARALSGLSSRALRKRAEAVGIDEAALSRAYKSKEPKRALIALILSVPLLPALLSEKKTTSAAEAVGNAAGQTTEYNCTAAGVDVPSQVDEPDADAPTTRRRSSETQLDKEDTCRQADDAELSSTEQHPQSDSPTVATGEVRVNSSDFSIASATSQDKPKGDATISIDVGFTPASPGAPAESQATESTTRKLDHLQSQQVEEEVTTDEKVDNLNGPVGVGGDRHAAVHEDVADGAICIDNSNDDSAYEHLDTSSPLPGHMPSASIEVSEGAAFVDSVGRMMKLPVVDLQLAAQGSRLRKERLRLEARAASPASRGTV